MRTIVLSPYNVANFQEGGGHFWVYMQYAQSLRELGCRVFWMEGFRSRGSAKADATFLAPFFDRMESYGWGGKVILYATNGHAAPSPDPPRFIGMAGSEVEAICREADLLLNFHYAIEPGLHARFRRTALVDIDPGLLQFWISRGQLSVPRHDLYFTTGETVGTPQARFPDCGLSWIRIRPPVCLTQWPAVQEPRATTFCTVSNWDADDWIVDDDDTYENTKRVAFLEYAALPRLTRQPLELALYLRTWTDIEERRQLEKQGWRIRMSREVAGTPEAYRAYIQRSRGEFSCARPSCVRMQNAWISDRTLCYLASGKPVVVQHTGPSTFLPDAEGIFRFRTLREAAEAMDAANADYERHSNAARRLAETYFDGRRIVKEILTRALD